MGVSGFQASIVDRLAFAACIVFGPFINPVPGVSRYYAVCIGFCNKKCNSITKSITIDGRKLRSGEYRSAQQNAKQIYVAIIYLQEKLFLVNQFIFVMRLVEFSSSRAFAR